MKQKTEWTYVPFIEAVDILDSFRKPINRKERDNRILNKKTTELFPYYGATGRVGYIDDFLLEGEYVLLGEDGAPFLDAYANKAYMITGKSWVNNHAHILRSKYNNSFLCYYLNYFNYKGYVSGTTRLKLTQSDMKRIPIPVPPIAEQERIVSQIEESLSQLDSAVETLKKTKQQLEVYRQAVLKDVLADKPKWTRCHLGDVIDVLTDYHSNGSYKVLKENVTLLDDPSYAIMVRSTNFEKNDFHNDLKYIDEHSYRFLKKSQLFGGEVLMGKIGNAGKVYYMKKLSQPMSLAMNMFAMRFKETVLSKYVYYYLLSPQGKMDIKRYVKGVGTPTIDKKSVRSLLFAYPSLEEQEQVVNVIEQKVSSCDSIEQIVNRSLQQAEALRQSILKQAFEG